jgi:hypothetical protein
VIFVCEVLSTLLILKEKKYEKTNRKKHLNSNFVGKDNRILIRLRWIDAQKKVTVIWVVLFALIFSA